MASPEHCQAPDEHELKSFGDFQLFQQFLSLVSREHSSEVKALAYEIMRRYIALQEEQSEESLLIRRTLGTARWGDARDVERIFGIKRGPLDRLRKAGKIDSCSLADEPGKATQHASRNKRLYDLVSVLRYVELCKSREREGLDAALPPTTSTIFKWLREPASSSSKSSIKEDLAPRHVRRGGREGVIS